MPETPTADGAADPLSEPARPELTGGKRVGVLLSHGFTGSPFSMKPWARHLAEKGYAVEVPRLPGHGTTWQQMNTTTWADWYGEVSRAFSQLRAENDAVVVGGLSMGAALVLQLASEHDAEIAGVVVVNPAVATKRKDVKLLPVLKYVVPAFPAIANDIKKPGQDEHGHTSSRVWAASPSRSSTCARPRTTSSTRCPRASSVPVWGRLTSAGIRSRTATTSRRSTTTPT
jgi:carboxylesterase